MCVSAKCCLLGMSPGLRVGPLQGQQSPHAQAATGGMHSWQQAAALSNHQAAPAGRACKFFGGWEGFFFFWFFFPSLSIMLSPALWRAWMKHSNLFWVKKEMKKIS